MKKASCLALEKDRPPYASNRFERPKIPKNPATYNSLQSQDNQFHNHGVRCLMAIGGYHSTPLDAR